MGYLVIGETRKEKERKEIRIVMWGFVVKGKKEKEREKKREKGRRMAMPVRTECGVFEG